MAIRNAWERNPIGEATYDPATQSLRDLQCVTLALIGLDWRSESPEPISRLIMPSTTSYMIVLVSNNYTTLFYPKGARNRWLWVNYTEIAVLKTIYLCSNKRAMGRLKIMLTTNYLLTNLTNPGRSTSQNICTATDLRSHKRSK